MGWGRHCACTQNIIVEVEKSSNLNMSSDPPLHVALGPDLRRPSVGDPFGECLKACLR